MDKIEIGTIIKKKRLQLNLRMDDVAREIDISRASLCCIENGSGNYSIDILLNLLNYLNISIGFETINQETRKRATRVNSALDKQINRFVVMCVEQYAYSINKSSGYIYKRLKEIGAIQELIDDYEDMHGMSTYSLNEYIDNRMSKG